MIEVLVLVAALAGVVAGLRIYLQRIEDKHEREIDLIVRSHAEERTRWTARMAELEEENRGHEITLNMLLAEVDK